MGSPNVGMGAEGHMAHGGAAQLGKQPGWPYQLLPPASDLSPTLLFIPMWPGAGDAREEGVRASLGLRAAGGGRCAVHAVLCCAVRCGAVLCCEGSANLCEASALQCEPCGWPTTTSHIASASANGPARCPACTEMLPRHAPTSTLLAAVAAVVGLFYSLFSAEGRNWTVWGSALMLLASRASQVYFQASWLKGMSGR